MSRSTMKSDIVERLRLLAAVDNCQASLEAADEIERLRAGGCARDQGTTQYCAEAAKLAAEIEKLRSALEVFACDCTEDELCKFPHACRNYVARAALEGRT